MCNDMSGFSYIRKLLIVTILKTSLWSQGGGVVYFRNTQKLLTSLNSVHTEFTITLLSNHCACIIHLICTLNVIIAVLVIHISETISTVFSTMPTNHIEHIMVY